MSKEISDYVDKLNLLGDGVNVIPTPEMPCSVELAKSIVESLTLDTRGAEVNLFCDDETDLISAALIKLKVGKLMLLCSKKIYKELKENTVSVH